MRSSLSHTTVLSGSYNSDTLTLSSRSLSPASPANVSYPLGSCMIKSWQFAAKSKLDNPKLLLVSIVNCINHASNSCNKREQNSSAHGFVQRRSDKEANDSSYDHNNEQYHCSEFFHDFPTLYFLFASVRFPQFKDYCVYIGGSHSFKKKRNSITVAAFSTLFQFQLF